MNYEHFLAAISKGMKKHEGKGVRVYVKKILKNNGTSLDGLILIRDGENVSPVIYLKPFYQMMENGMPIETILDRILSYYYQYRHSGLIDPDFFQDFERAKSRLVCRLINYEKNEELLSDIPHVRFLDLAIVFYYLLEDCDLGSGSILIHEEHRKLWGISVEELYACARENTSGLLPAEVLNMKDFIDLMEEMYKIEEEDVNVSLYVLTNNRKFYGAVHIVYEEVRRKIGEMLKEDYYVLPGSVHECMIVPVSGSMGGADTLQTMVKEINETQVEEQEILSDSVYRCSWQNGEIQLVSPVGQYEEGGDENA